ncbi:hypothetical protein SRB5_71130 [Streptomyces sp. RB5]|uniref:Insertion element IS402-like domain-containing protein n=1 Tax=Streptomyces smaragdinus TaxID=2585196 RepID=A0A7K0CTX0_9ACTN|nr:hypothetical protein [Streptomyces smaragdinus]
MAVSRPYPNDLSDARWARIEPVLTSWRAKRWKMTPPIGRPPEHDLREILNAILWIDRTGAQWRSSTVPQTRPAKSS